MRNKKVVVTGGAGFIGSNIIRSLVEDDNQVIVIDNLSTGDINNVKDLIDTKKIHFINSSINDLDLLQTEFKEVEFVFHEAAIPSVPRSVEDPVSTNYSNVNGTLNVLKAANDNNVKKVVYASSSSIYGDIPTLPKKEDMMPFPLSPYAVTKLTGEYYCNVFNDIYGLETTVLRYFNVFGPRQDPSSQYSAVIPKFVTSLKNRKPPIIYGDGTQTRDFSYVKNIVDANIKAAESKSRGIYNIAGGKSITVTDLADIIMELMDIQMDCKYIDARAGDIKHSLADISKAKKELGYDPKYDVRDGLEETIKWYQQTN